MNRQKLILIAIFAVTFVIGFSAILVSILFSQAPQKPTTTNQSTQIPSLTSVKLYCTSASSGTSLTFIWQSPTLPNSDTINGQVTDISTGADPTTVGPFSNTTTNSTYTGSNGVDTYYVSLWVQDSSGSKGEALTSNQLDSAQCSTGQAPVAPSISASPSPTSSPTTTSTTTATPTPTASTTSALACNTFTIQQNGTTVASNTVAPGSSTVTIVPGISSPSGGVLNYSAAVWTISPSSPTLAVSTDQSSATWTPPTSVTSSTYTVSLSGVTDSNSNSLASACTVTLTLSSSLPNTAGANPTQLFILVGMLSIVIGIFLYTKGDPQNI